jgi:hypothetical protein
MATPQTTAERITEIQKILEAGVAEVSYGGTTTKYDFDQLRAELRRLQSADEDTPNRRPVAASVFLGGF